MANDILTINMIARETMRLWTESNPFIMSMAAEEAVAADAGLELLTETLVSPQAVVALGVTAAVIKNPTVTRRFWDPSTW